MKVVILTAGIGSRLNERTKYFNKALLRVSDKAVISHTIDQFSDGTEFVIALGYKGDIVKQYLQMYHPEQKFIFVDIDKYSIPGSGPGYALIKCQEHLQEPFFFVSCDTIAIPNSSDSIEDLIENNWVGCAPIDPVQSSKYCTVLTDLTNPDSNVLDFIDKPVLPMGTSDAFIGLAFIKDYKDFWQAMNSNDTLIGGEIQLSPALKKLSNLKPLFFRWWDTGSEEGLLQARKDFVDVVENLDKLDEEIYFGKDFVLKYFHNESMAKNRVVRAKTMGNSIPKILASSKNFYKYSYTEGQDLFKDSAPHKLMKMLLDFSQKELWSEEIKLNQYDSLIFKDVCKNFYFDKTLSRLDKLYEKLSTKDEQHEIHYETLPTLKYMFERMPWNSIFDGVPSKFHGDWNFSNIIVNTIHRKDPEFTFIDWRQDFGGLIEYGDRYYDFAKMYACLLWPHPSVKKQQFKIRDADNTIAPWIFIPQSLADCVKILDKWIFDNGYDLRKTKLLTAIVWLNMASLHESPLDEHLYMKGKYLLYKTLLCGNWEQRI
jgi:NDP-sugar pyrophosphorylase family protein